MNLLNKLKQLLVLLWTHFDSDSLGLLSAAINVSDAFERTP